LDDPGEECAVLAGLGERARPGDGLRPDDPPADTHHEIAAVLFTSGTTGPAKGCSLSHRYALYHLDAAYLCVVPAILLGCRAAVSARFSASRFWDEIREVGATVFDFMGATLTILAKRDPLPSEAWAEQASVPHQAAGQVTAGH
jgi:acyl-CoA synthetase (AMP-forming)/AMP-acid ligase II